MKIQSVVLGVSMVLAVSAVSADSVIQLTQQAKVNSSVLSLYNDEKQSEFILEYENSSVCEPGIDGSSGYKNGYRILTPVNGFTNISYYVDPSMGSSWVAYARSAAAKINAIGSSLNVSIVTIPVNGSSHIYYSSMPACVAAGALPPTMGRIGAEIKINPNLANYSEKVIVGSLIHEMLHTVGFQHAAQNAKGVFINNTDHVGMWQMAKYKPIMMANSGNYELSYLDKYAIKQKFPK